MKRLSIAVAMLFALSAQALAAGSISLSLSQQFDSTGRPLSGGLLYFFAAGTTTPQSAYQDSGLTIAYANPITLDASGRVPAFYLADGNIKIRLTDSTGVTVIAADNILVIGPSSGGGGGGSVDATTVLATGDVKARYGTGTLTGFVRLNGRTIGSATSGATERAAADAQTLFEYLWNNDPNLSVSTGRGATANADWVANKTITLPDMRGRHISGLDDMGASAASRLTSTGLGVATTTLGNAGGAETRTLTTTELPAHTHGVSGNTGIESADHGHLVSGNTGTESADHTHSVSLSGSTDSAGDHSHTVTANNGTTTTFAAGANSVGTTSPATQTTNTTGAHQHTVSLSGTSGGKSATHTHSIAINTGGVSVPHTHAFSVTSASSGTGSAFSTVTPTLLMTFYMKL